MGGAEGVGVDSAAYHGLLARVPELAEAIAAAVCHYRTLPLTALYLTGSLPLGAYSPHGSDIDFIAITPRSVSEFEGALRRVLAACWQLAPNPNTVFLERRVLAEPEPEGIWVSDPGDDLGSRYRLHAIDVILLRKYSVLLFGEDVRAELAPFDEAEVIGDSAAHVAAKMLPPVVDAIRRDPEFPLNAFGHGGLVTLMARTLYTLHTRHLASKPEASRWVRSLAEARPHLAPLAELAELHATWYEEGRPAEVDTRASNARFVEAVAGFVTELRRHGVARPEPET